MKKILLTAIGGTDMISNRHDGPILHIARNEKPEQIIIFMTTAYKERKKEIKTAIASIKKYRPELKYVDLETDRPHRFDEMYKMLSEKFEREDISNEIKDNELLLNISSGTPALKSALILINQFLELNAKAIQVSNPKTDSKQRKKPESKEDIKAQIKENEDNNEKSENRCFEENSIYLVNDIKKNIFNNFIKKYDYEAASEISEQLNEDEPKDKNKILKGLLAINMVDKEKVVASFGKTEFGENFSGKDNKYRLFYYLLCLRIKIKRKMYADFIRAMTPAITYLFRIILEEQGTKFEDFANNREGSWIIDYEQIENNNDLPGYIENLLQNRNNNEYVKNKMLFESINYDDENKCEKLQAIWSIEDTKELRNKLAHEMVKCNDKKITNMIEVTPDKILDYCFDLLKDSWKGMPDRDVLKKINKYLIS